MLIFAVIVALFFISPKAEADIYKYVDTDGVTHFTNAPAHIDASYKKVMTERDRVSYTHKGKYLSTGKRSDYNNLVQSKSRQYNMDPNLVKAVIKAESNWNPKAVSRKGAMGLMQLMPSTAYNLSVGNSFDPEENVDGGIRYLKYLIEKFDGNLTLALAAYNAGPKAVERYGTVPPIAETHQYVKKVLTLYGGKTEVATDSRTHRRIRQPIYKIIFEDGTVLFTNTPLAYQELKPSKM